LIVAFGMPDSKLSESIQVDAALPADTAAP
jgi:hypothetical protein